MIERNDRVDVLAPPGPELVVRESGLLYLAQSLQKRQVAPGHLDVHRVGQPRSVGVRLGFFGCRGERAQPLYRQG